MSVPASTWTDWFSHGSTASDSLLAHSQDPARAIARDHQRAETESPAALDDLRAAVNPHQLLIEWPVLLRPPLRSAPDDRRMV